MFQSRWKLAGDRGPLRFRSAEPFDAPLMQSEHFVCVPSLGSILPGWVLITPKRPMLNIAQVPKLQQNELRAFFQMVRDEVERCYGETCAFEHGAQIVGSATGCGVDQAHLHIVPLAADRVRGQVSEQMAWHETPFAMPFDADMGAQDYLWLSGRHHTYLAHPTTPVSQFFRRAIADICGVKDEWDYRLNPFHEHIAATRRVLGGAAEVPNSRAA